MKTTISSCLARQETLLERFSFLQDAKSRYDLIMEMGRELSKSNKKEIATPQNLVRGCQSEVYLTASLQQGKVFFDAYSEALVSTGLIALLLSIYQGEAPETILLCPPDCFEKLGIHASLTPGRSNGLASIYLKMKQEALQLLVKNKS